VSSITSIFSLLFILIIFFAIAVFIFMFLIIRMILNSVRNSRYQNSMAPPSQFGGPGWLEPAAPQSSGWFGGEYTSPVSGYDGSDLAPQAVGGWESAGAVDSNVSDSGGFTGFGGGGDFGGGGAGGDFGGGSDFSSSDSGGGSSSSE